QNDLHEHGAWRKRREDLFRSDTKQAVRKCGSLARKREIVLPVALSNTSGYWFMRREKCFRPALSSSPQTRPFRMIMRPLCEVHVRIGGGAGQSQDPGSNDEPGAPSVFS